MGFLQLSGLQEINLQAEDGTYNSTAQVKTLGSGWTGSGFVNFMNAPGSVQMNVNISAENDYVLDIKYANGGGSAAIKLTIDGVVVNPSVTMPTTNSWNTIWSSVQQAVHLTSGSHAITVETVGTAYINLDAVIATEVTVPPTPGPFDEALQAEDAAHSAGITTTSYGSGWNGSGYSNFNNGPGYIEWTADVPEANYTLKFAYANGSGSRSMKLIVDGKEITTLSFPGTGHWNLNWSVAAYSLDLTAGEHTIRLETTGTSGPNIDQLLFTEN
ncbi:carbohydrate-binding protein [Paenibacillus sp. BK720]|uniref:carbohydrate-binding protein n=1 Tax=Paenibacillus sp. BK720 TaxID=2587092 RepID=UPI00141F5E37|nr:carbohydrate-binding protein [Paenibacillus sp. BK720]NIK67032.1 hypothetical protein [Paenibacillus sp. BK720]